VGRTCYEAIVLGKKDSADEETSPVPHAVNAAKDRNESLSGATAGTVAQELEHAITVVLIEDQIDSFLLRHVSFS